MLFTDQSVLCRVNVRRKSAYPDSLCFLLQANEIKMSDSRRAVLSALTVRMLRALYSAPMNYPWVFRFLVINPACSMTLVLKKECCFFFYSKLNRIT